jgi:GMP synthase (glutamine-hydrolysing)
VPSDHGTPAGADPCACAGAAGTILVIVHQAHSTPGRIGQRLSVRGYGLDVRRPALGDPLPADLAGYAGVVIFGGPMSANDSHAFIREETDFSARVLAEGRPLLGICLGAQIMARALGARVAPHAQGVCEIGYYPLAATEAGRALLDWPSHVYHWHSEGFDLPAGAQLLATGETFPHQAFRYGRNAFALQFHPEVTREMMSVWIVRGAHRFGQPGAQAGETHLQGWERYDGAIDRWLDRFLHIWLGEAAAAQPGAPEAGSTPTEPPRRPAR